MNVNYTIIYNQDVQAWFYKPNYKADRLHWYHTPEWWII